MPHSSSARRHRRLLALLPPVSVVLAVAVVFGRSCAGEWLHWDDDVNVWLNPGFHPVSASSLAAFWARPYAQLYVPLTYTVWGLLAAMAQHRNGGGWPVALDPVPFHLINVIVHASAAVGVFALLRRLGLRAWAAAAGAALFALHPLQAEPVAWITGLKDVLSGSLCVWALWCHVGPNGGVADAGAPLQSARRGSWAATGLFVAAMLAKPQAVCLPLIAVALDRLLLRRRWADVAWRVAPWLVLAVPIVAIGHLAQPTERWGPAPVIVRPLVALDDLTFYLGKVVWPAGLSVDYAHTTARLLSSDRRWWSWAPAVALLLCCAAARRRWPWVAAAGAVFVAALLPTLGLVPFTFQEVSNVADRYAYLALLGPAMLLARALDRAALAAPRAARVAAAAGTVIALLLLAVAAHAQVRLWHDDERLFEHAVALNPFAARARVHLATLRFRQNRPDQAEALYRRALALAPHEAVGQFDYANLLQKRGDFAGAIEHYRRAIERMPDDPSFHTNLATALLHTGQVDQAIAEFRRSAELDPADKQVWMALGSALVRRGDLPSAAAALSKAVDIDPNFAPAKQLLAQVRSSLQQQQQQQPSTSH